MLEGNSSYWRKSLYLLKAGMLPAHPSFPVSITPIPTCRSDPREWAVTSISEPPDPGQLQTDFAMTCWSCLGYTGSEQDFLTQRTSG